MQVHEMVILETLRSQNGPPLEHDPEKWIPVFRKDHAQKIIQSAITIAL
jgi:hypothetical protein